MFLRVRGRSFCRYRRVGVHDGSPNDDWECSACPTAPSLAVSRRSPSRHGAPVAYGRSGDTWVHSSIDRLRLTRWKRAERGELPRESCGRSVMSRGDVSSAADRDPHGERGDIGGDPQLRPAHDRMDPDRTQWRHACLRRGSRESWQGIGGPRFAQWVAAGIIAPIAGLGGEPSEGGRTAAPDRRLRSPVSELGERPSDVAPACCCTNLP